MAKNRTKKIITAGMLVVEAIYPRIERGDSDRCRAAKHKASSEAQKRLNAVHSWQQLELSLAANYGAGDLWVTVTYDDEHLPRNRKEAKLRFKYFLAKLAQERKKRKREAVVHACTEHKHRHEDHWQDRRWHHHFVLNASGDDYELIRRCWIYGSNIEIRKLRLDAEHTFEQIARYMCKEAPDKLGQHCWMKTRNAKKPEVETVRVDSDEQLQIPRGALRLLSEGGEDLYSKWRVVKYMLPGWDRPAAPRARRRRR